MPARAKVKNARFVPVSLTPILQNVSVQMGAYTNKGSGGVYLRNLGLTTSASAPVTLWKISGIAAVGGGAASDLTNTCATDTATATARTPMPSAGDNVTLGVTLAATSYTMTVTGTGSDGTTATCTLTFVVQANAFNMGDDFAGRDSPLGYNGYKTQMGGLTLLISTGADYSTYLLDLENIISSGALLRTSVRYADTARPSPMGSVNLYNCRRIDVYGMAYNGLPISKFVCRAASVDCHDYDAYSLGTSAATMEGDRDVNGNPLMNAHMVFQANEGSSGCTMERANIRYCGRPASFHQATDCYLLDSDFRYYYADVIQWGDITNCGLRRCRFASPMRALNNDDHIDGGQIGDGNTATGAVVDDLMIFQADGNAGTIPFINGGAATVLTYRRVLVLHRAGTTMNGAYHAGGSLIQDATFFVVPSGTIGQTHITEGDKDNIVADPLTSSITMSAGAGSNTMDSIFTSGSIFSSAASWTKTNCVAASATYTTTQFSYIPGVYNREPTWTGTFDWSSRLNYADAFERLGNLTAANPNGFDWANATLDQMEARALLILTPKSGGALDRGGGLSNGFVNLNGTKKT